MQEDIFEITKKAEKIDRPRGRPRKTDSTPKKAKNKTKKPGRGIVNPTRSIDGVELLTAENVAEFLGVSKQALLIWREEGSGPNYLCLGSRTIRYPKAEVLKWLNASLVQKQRKKKVRAN